MLSRLAENLYWMGRYIERAENTARLLDVNYHVIVEALYLSKGLLTEQWALLLNITGDAERFRAYFERADRNTVPEWLTSHRENSSSIRMSFTRARENARALRDRISTEMWNALNRAFFQPRRGHHAARSGLAFSKKWVAFGARRQRAADSSGTLPAV